MLSMQIVNRISLVFAEIFIHRYVVFFVIQSGMCHASWAYSDSPIWHVHLLRVCYHSIAAVAILKRSFKVLLDVLLASSEHVVHSLRCIVYAIHSHHACLLCLFELLTGLAPCRGYIVVRGERILFVFNVDLESIVFQLLVYA